MIEVLKIFRTNHTFPICNGISGVYYPKEYSVQINKLETHHGSLGQQHKKHHS